MLYLDASALVKRYYHELGSDAVQARFERRERIFTSALSYAEVHAALVRKYRAGEIWRKKFVAARQHFVKDWLFSLNIMELDTKTMVALPELVEVYPLKASDAVHLSAAIWLRDVCRPAPDLVGGDASVEFGVADRTLARVAGECELTVFNPEDLG